MNKSVIVSGKEKKNIEIWRRDVECLAVGLVVFIIQTKVEKVIPKTHEFFRSSRRRKKKRKKKRKSILPKLLKTHVPITCISHVSHAISSVFTTKSRKHLLQN